MVKHVERLRLFWCNAKAGSQCIHILCTFSRWLTLMYISIYMYRSYWYSDSLIHSETFFFVWIPSPWDCKKSDITAPGGSTTKLANCTRTWWPMQVSWPFFFSRRKVHFLMLKLFITCPSRKCIFKTFQCLRIYHVEDVSGDSAVWRKLLMNHHLMPASWDGTLDWSNSHARRSSRSSQTLQGVVLTIFFVAEGTWLGEPH